MPYFSLSDGYVAMSVTPFGPQTWSPLTITCAERAVALGVGRPPAPQVAARVDDQQVQAAGRQEARRPDAGARAVAGLDHDLGSWDEAPGSTRLTVPAFWSMK